MPDYGGYKCGYCTAAAGVNRALYAKVVSPDLLLGNRWGRLICVGDGVPLHVVCLGLPCKVKTRFESSASRN
jgi:hypothetical protein